MKVEITAKQAKVLNDVLWEVEEYRVYYGDDLEALEELKNMFSWGNVKNWNKESKNE